MHAHAEQNKKNNEMALQYNMPNFTSGQFIASNISHEMLDFNQL